jgi:outer membrane protein assembly factor BamB
VQVAGNTVLLSLRHTNAVYAIDRRTGAVLWKLGGTRTAESVTVDGADAGALLSGQHFARLSGNGILTVHDNGTTAGRPPRALRLRIDAAERTATLVEQFRDPLVQTSACCGSAARLGDGRWVVSWGGQSVVGEYAPGGAAIWRLRFGDDLFSYRAIPIQAGALSKPQLRAAMSVLNPRR